MDYLIRPGRTMIKLSVEHPAITTRIPSPVPIWRSRIRSRATEAMAHPNQAAAKYPSIAAVMSTTWIPASCRTASKSAGYFAPRSPA
jgi:hypothetical protein